MNIIRFPILWFVSMTWHLWCIASLRPDFRRLADTGFTFVSFFGIFCAASWIRWSVLSDATPFEVMGTVAIWSTILLIASERSQRSSALFFTLLGCSAVVDLSASAAQVLGHLELLSRQSWLLVEVLMMAGAYRHFLRMPAEVQAGGYRRKTVAEQVEN